MASSDFDLVWLAVFCLRKKIGISADQPFRQRKRLRQKRPVIDFQRIEAVHSRPVVIGRQNIQHGETRQPARMVEREAVGDAAAAIMSGEREMHVAELLHRLDQGFRHRALGVGRVSLIALWHVRPAIARQIRDDQRELVGELRRDAVPNHMRLGKAVQQQQRRSLAADTGENAPGFCVDPFGSVTGKEIGEIGHGCTHVIIRERTASKHQPFPSANGATA